jgi:hypothetical protein
MIIQFKQKSAYTKKARKIIRAVFVLMFGLSTGRNRGPRRFRVLAQQQ